MRSVLCFGDSNTHGTLPMTELYVAARLGPTERWPGVMRAVLGPGWQVIEEGLPGRTTVHPDPIEGADKCGEAALPMLLGSHLPLDLVIVMLGTNDLKPRFAVPAADIALSAEKLVMQIGASTAGPGGGAPRVLMVAPPPILEVGPLAPLFAGGAAKSAAFGRLFGEAAARRGAAFLDAGRVIASSPLDGIHFDAPAHEALGRAMAAEVARLFP
jgi:lysophospholipase L1-like esterase